jgi:polysaccharide export outer membrane protein
VPLLAQLLLTGPATGRALSLARREGPSVSRHQSWLTAGLVVGGLWLGACAHQATPPPAVVSDEPYRIGREDVLDVAVWRDSDLSRTLPVRPDGFITLPMVGEVQAEGRTTVELEQDIARRLQKYIQNPRVTVMVREVNSARIFVTGEVAKPGAYPLRGNVSVLQALAMAGGLSEFASGNRIVVIRGNNGPRIPVRYSDLTSANPNGADFPLQPGDTVVVP